MPENNPIRVAVCDPNASRRAALAARVCDASVEVCDNLAALRELLRSRDAVLIADPCPSRAVVETLFAVAKEAGGQFVTLNPDRYLPSRQLIRKQLSGPLGEVGLVRLHRWESAPDQPGDWPAPLFRDIDVTLWLMGRQPNRVFAVGQHGRCVQVHLGFASGGMALLDVSNGLPAGDGYQSLSVIAASGAGHADDHQNMQLLYRGGHPRAVRTEERAGQLAAIAREFVETLRAGRDVMTANAAEWRNVFAVADAVVKSVATGQAVALEDR